jgi:hypothetical protein
MVQKRYDIMMKTKVRPSSSFISERKRTHFLKVWVDWQEQCKIIQLFLFEIDCIKLIGHSSHTDSSCKYLLKNIALEDTVNVTSRHAPNPNRLEVWVKKQKSPNRLSLWMTIFSKLSSLGFKYLFMYVDKQNIFICFKLLSKKRVDLGTHRC